VIQLMQQLGPVRANSSIKDQDFLEEMLLFGEE
jgi:hypothetical protein